MLVDRTGAPIAHAGPFDGVAAACWAGRELVRLVAGAGAGHRAFVEVVRVVRLCEVSDGD